MIDIAGLYLAAPSVGLWRDFRAAGLAFRRERTEDYAYPRVDTRRQFRHYLRGLAQTSVPTDTYWLTDGAAFVGSGCVRHTIDEGLALFGGHIGYAVRPCYQGQGVGTRLLGLLLERARLVGVETARVTCFDENEASARVIERNGGVLAGKVYNRIRGVERLTRLYDIGSV